MEFCHTGYLYEGPFFYLHSPVITQWRPFFNVSSLSRCYYYFYTWSLATQSTVFSTKAYFLHHQWYPHHLFSYPLLAGMKSLLLWKTDNTNAQQSISRPSDSGTWGHITTCLSPFNLSIHHTNGTQRSSQLRQHRSSLNSTKYPQKIPPQHSSWQPWFPTHLTQLLRTHRMDSSREHGQLYTHPSY